ncbi:MAG: hypothetical protein Kow0062_23440 [Acidobacteriota bacterium]
MVTEWQRTAQSRTDALLQRYGESVDWRVVEVGEDPFLLQQEGDVYLMGTIVREPHRYEIYIYTDEAGIYLNRDWHPFELPDWENDPAKLLEGFLRFLGERLAGTSDGNG